MFQMQLLGDGIYCKKRIFESAHGASHKATHLARRLLTGVFKHDVLIKATFTGQAPRSLGKERLQERVVCLNLKARHAMIGEFQFSLLIVTYINECFQIIFMSILSPSFAMSYIQNKYRVRFVGVVDLISSYLFFLVFLNSLLEISFVSFAFNIGHLKFRLVLFQSIQ